MTKGSAKQPTFNADGYPTDETLETIKNWDCVGKPARRALMEYVQRAWRYSEYFTRKGDKWHVSTVGWSGNESLIGAMQENFLFWSLCWEQARRGGHYIFIDEGGE